MATRKNRRIGKKKVAATQRQTYRLSPLTAKGFQGIFP